MKYYIKNPYGFTEEISRDKFYSLKRRKNARISVRINGGLKTGYNIWFD